MLRVGRPESDVTWRPAYMRVRGGITCKGRIIDSGTLNWRLRLPPRRGPPAVRRGRRVGRVRRAGPGGAQRGNWGSGGACARDEDPVEQERRAVERVERGRVLPGGPVCRVQMRQGQMRCRRHGMGCSFRGGKEMNRNRDSNQTKGKRKKIKLDEEMERCGINFFSLC